MWYPGLVIRIGDAYHSRSIIVYYAGCRWHSALGNGWFAITPTDSDTSAARVLEWLDVQGVRA